MLADLTLMDFLKKIASDSPVPGGGSAAALNAALAAALSEMVANLTIGKKGYESVQKQMENIAENASSLREKLTADIDKDANAYHAVMEAYKLPKNTESEKNRRNAEIQTALKTAAYVPLSVAEDAIKIIELAQVVIQQGNKNASTDGMVALMMAKTAACSAAYNVRINLKSIKDDNFVDTVSRRIEEIESAMSSE